MDQDGWWAWFIAIWFCGCKTDLVYGDAACYKAGWAIGIKGINITAIDLFCRQSNIEVALQYHFSMCKRIATKNGALLLYYDASVAQEAVYEPVWLRAAKQYKSMNIPMPQKSSTDKYTKIDTTLSSVFVAGIIAFSKTLLQTPTGMKLNGNCSTLKR